MHKKVTVEVYGTGDTWRWRVVHGNGKILAASSEAFATRAGAKRNLQRTRDALKQITDIKLKVA